MMYEIRLKSSFKIKMDMKEAEEYVQLQKALAGRVRRMRPQEEMLDEEALEKLKLQICGMIKWK